MELDYIITGLELFFQGNNNSVNVRIENLYQAMDWFEDSIIFGYGPAKAIHPTVIDSEYALILGRYGIVGVFVFGFYIFTSIRKSVNLLILHNCKKPTAVSALSVYATFGLVLMLTNNLFSGYQLMAPFVVFGMCLELFEIRNNKIIKGKYIMNKLMNN